MNKTFINILSNTKHIGLVFLMVCSCLYQFTGADESADSFVTRNRLVFHCFQLPPVRVGAGSTLNLQKHSQYVGAGRVPARKQGRVTTLQFPTLNSQIPNPRGSPPP